MPRQPRDSRIETREARGRLKVRREPYWRQVQQGVFVGYRKHAKQAGSWYIREYEGGKYRKRRIATADDFADSDGAAVLSYNEVVKQAINGVAAASTSGYTVADALDDYLAELRVRSKSYTETRQKAEQHIRPEIGTRRVDRLTAPRLRSWLNEIAATDDPDPEAQRRKKATANRVLTVLKAALNQAYRDEKVASDAAWRRVQPFRGADQPKIRYLIRDESVRLVNAADPEFRPLVRAALLTGCRWGELIGMLVEDYDPDASTIRVRVAKGGTGRHVPLTSEGAALFDELTAGRERSELLFTRADGEAWGKSQQHRRMREACRRASIQPPVGFHVLRHTYGSLLALQGVPLQVIARAMGHSDTRMTERHYAHLQPDHVADRVRAALPDFGGGESQVRVARRK